MILNDSSDHKSIHIGIVLVVIVATIAVAAILWQMLGTLEGTSTQVHQYIEKSKEPESNMAPIVKGLPKVLVAKKKQSAVINKPQAVLTYEEGLAKSKNRDLGGAFKAFTAAIDMVPKLPPDQDVTVDNGNVAPKRFLAMCYSSRADCSMFALKYKEAISDYTKAIAQNPDEPAYYAARANCWSRLGKDKEAMKDFKEMSLHDTSLTLP